MTDWLPVNDMLLWCREVDSDNTRQVLESIGDAVAIAVEKHLNRPLFATQAEMDAMDPVPEHAMVVDPVIKQAAMLLVSHFNENREAALEVNLEEMPYGYTYLLNDYRIRSNP